MKTIVDVKGATINGNELWFLNEMAQMVNKMTEKEIDRCPIGNTNSTLLKSIAREILSHNERAKRFIEIDDSFAYTEDIKDEWINHESSSVSSESADGSDTMDAPA